MYLDTSRDVDEPDRAVELRRRHLRGRLLAHDADLATVGAIEDAVGADREIAGRHGQAIFAARGRLALVECLPEPPASDSAKFGMLPDVLPLVLQHTPDIPYAVVAIHRLHSPAPGGEDELEVDQEIGRWPMSRVAPAGRTHRRIAVGAWSSEVEPLLGRVADRLDAAGTEVIVLSGDPWAVNVVTRPAPKRLHDRFVKIKDGSRRKPEPGRATLEKDLGELFTDRLPSRDQQLLDVLRARRVRRPDEVEGLAAVVTALQRGQTRAHRTPARRWSGRRPRPGPS
ncbi:hypothetical protein [Kitasatospora purpeofusca]|uniref:baeRF2 domain-containing protein n=1 Tax=Kitasatospora purpeofusca TaxID=67352 RepID=UPI002A5A9EA9|nr:hypothetical protein [Kitasatospora purpeofusca]MDY0812549.1 hypothetical protein [Kitasatospora purpeofusca]